MCNLIEDGTWHINKNKARLWVTDQGTFILWVQYTNELNAYFKDRKIHGVPHHPNPIAEILVEYGVADAYKDEEDETSSLFWPVAPEEIQNPGKDPLVLRCLKLADPGKLL